MPDRGFEATVGPRRRRRRTLRTLVLAALLAAATTLLGAGVASADYWPHAETGTVTGPQS